MKKVILLLCTLFIGLQSTDAQSLKNLFSKKNVSRMASNVGIKTPLKLEGSTWQYAGTALELKTDNALKKAAAEMAAIAAEEKINEQLSSLGISLGMVRFQFEKDGKLMIQAKNKKLPATYQLSKDQKVMTISLAQRMSFNADVNHSLETMSLLFEADKLMDLITFISEKSQSTSLQTIGALAKNYDGMKIGIQLEKAN
ncbi:hypothetical protein Bcop_0901 [Bacteroides coprosuis DSM 18011]|uniref:DUF4923 domain-containing protein n=1 Tax=Bacteroides coprosuis DSM 18011 TaxID=679937 RepID=F3ZU11_9BACE|nr:MULTISPECIES: DUF4923 family protein [Bacteroides]EGJ71112.1 hypothetical protein Bcop_0901 [Bacteroides coprosuis DSM 18011]HJD91312.1 DUF4923 family protein [Bacteroides coprosuis]